MVVLYTAVFDSHNKVQLWSTAAQQILSKYLGWYAAVPELFALMCSELHVTHPFAAREQLTAAVDGTTCI